MAHTRCPKTGAPHRLMQRPDDNEATVAERLRVYDEKTRPLVDFYRARGLLRVINAEGAVNEVTRRLAQAIGAPLRAPPVRPKPTLKRVAGKRAVARKHPVTTARGKSAAARTTLRAPAKKSAVRRKGAKARAKRR